MNFGGKIDDRLQTGVGRFPVIDCALQVADLTEISVEPDQTGYVVGMIAATQKARARRFQVGRLGIECETCVTIADRNVDGLLIATISNGVAGFDIAIEIVDGVFLSLGPKRFAADIGAHR